MKKNTGKNRKITDKFYTNNNVDDLCFANLTKYKPILNKCKVIEPGFLEANKGVNFEKDVYLDSLTEKDKQAIKIANENGIKIFALSFANSSEDVKYMRSLLGKNNYLISKIESRKGFINRKKIIRFSDAVLIDRGDLSRYIEIPKIPIIYYIFIP